MTQNSTNYTLQDVESVLYVADTSSASYYPKDFDLGVLNHDNQINIFKAIDKLELIAAGTDDTNPQKLLSDAINGEQLAVDEHNTWALAHRMKDAVLIQPFEQNPQNVGAYPIRFAAEQAGLMYEIPDNQYGIFVNPEPGTGGGQIRTNQSPDNSAARGARKYQVAQKTPRVGKGTPRNAQKTPRVAQKAPRHSNIAQKAPRRAT